MFRAGFENRDGKNCKLKFDLLWRSTKPTGATEMPREVLFAKKIRDLILKNEVIGVVTHNSSDEENHDALPGTQLVEEDGSMSRPLPKKRKALELAEAFTNHGKLFASSTGELNKTLSKLIESSVTPKTNGISNELKKC